MALNAVSTQTVTSAIHPDQARTPAAPRWGRAVLAPLASLRVTVVLLACAIFIVLVGTLAQVDKDMLEVIRDYFRAWVAWIDFQVFFPRSWFPTLRDVPGGFWFPGGAAIGAALAINLLAAHLAVFTIQARGVRLWVGVLGLGLGIAYTAMVIVGGHNPQGLQGEAPLAWTTIWLLVKLLAAVIGVACAGAACLLAADRRVERRLLWGLAVFFLLSSVFLFAAGAKAYLGDSGMRILWQLIQASFAAAILLIACGLLFGARGGRVLSHGGIALIMFGQFYVSQYDIEEQMTIAEGQTVAFARDIRQTELAIVDRSRPDVDHISAIPRSLLLASEAGVAGSWWRRLSGRAWPVDDQGVIVDASLPFRVKVLTYFKNAELREAKPTDANPATAGTGRHYVAVPVKAGSGADSSGQVDMAAAYVRLTSQDGSRDIGTYLVAQIAAAQDIAEKATVDGKTYELSLRFRQNYKPYSLTLVDVRKDDYVGTNTPRNYSSDVRLVDPQRRVDREVHIWMNNPLRYAGETFYQSGYAGPPETPVESTTLQVVTNSGWMIPYVACMIVAFGMGGQFTVVLVRFLGRRTEIAEGRWRFSSRRESAPAATCAQSAPLSRLGAWSLTLLLLLLAGWLVSTWIPPRRAADGMDVYAFGQLPLVADGRVKPFDTLARNSLCALANRETFRDAAGERQPASRWLLDVIASPTRADKHKVFRIVNLEVLDTLGLSRRQGNLYSLAEIRPGLEAFEKQVRQVRRRDQAELSTYERKLLELDQQLHTYMQLVNAFQPLDIPPLPTPQDDQQASRKKIQAFQEAYSDFVHNLDRAQAPLAVPLTTNLEGKAESQWRSYARAWTDAYIGARLMGQSPDPALANLEAIFVAYSQKDAAAFNRQVAEYHARLQRDPLAELATKAGVVKRLFGGFYRFEAYFNHVSPFFHCAYLYLAAFVLAAVSWLGWSKPLNRAAFLAIAGTWLAHTAALVARIYISGRPPVTNLYSSAVFIGWGVVALAMVFEWLYRNGVGNTVAAVLGFASLLIAHNLAASGDTFKVLQAVLDTQFWLATHVVCIAFGYSTTFLAGGLGALYVLRGVLTPSLRADTRQDLTRMIYGTLCFGIFFSFFGTVLGGLWADDSWGRFWGWDPKENGALIIVLWNALVLHARWDGMVRDRGLAVLSVGGNIVTAWSWFGVNELGVGLHSYGFTEGVLLALGLFVASQIAIIVLGCLPQSLWMSERGQPHEAPQS